MKYVGESELERAVRNRIECRRMPELFSATNESNVLQDVALETAPEPALVNLVNQLRLPLTILTSSGQTVALLELLHSLGVHEPSHLALLTEADLVRGGLPPVSARLLLKAVNQ